MGWPVSTNVRVTYTVDDRDAQRAIRRLEDNLTSHSLGRFLYLDVATWLQHRAMGRFGLEGDDAVGKWTPLKLSTLLIRARKGFPTAPINVRSGQMKSFVTGSFGTVATRGGEEELTWPNVGNMQGSLAKKIMTAQMGKPSPATPPRPVIGVGELDSIYITAELTQHIMRGL